MKAHVTHRMAPSAVPIGTEVPPAPRTGYEQAGWLSIYPIEPTPMTDLDNARRLVHRHGGRLRYCAAWKTWLVYDGQRWQKDGTLLVERLAAETAASMAAEASTMPDAYTRRKMEDWARASQSHSRIRAMVGLATASPEVAIAPADLDRESFLLNCRNGTLDLRTGALRHHDPLDLISKLVPFRYSPDADCPTWCSFLTRVTRNDRELIDYLQRIAGYALTGDVGEHCLFLLYGTGRNGKGVFLNTLLCVVGDYGITIPSNQLTTNDRDQHPTGLADLDGRRLVIASEIESGKRMAEALVKLLTGGDRIRCRRLYRDFYEFSPTHKLFLATNYKPEIMNGDEGIWSRQRLIPFDVTIPEAERDTRLPDKLMAEAEGILAWAVRGCMEWRRSGLGWPAAVAEATATYRRDMDVIGQFLKARCTPDDETVCSTAQLHEAYMSWAREAGHSSIALNAFGRKLAEKGLKREKSSCARWRGYRLNG